MATHRYQARSGWSGSTGAGYDNYGRAHTAEIKPVEGQLILSSDPAFLGDPGLYNPEQLLLVAASSCQLLSFLAVAARARIDVIAYEDDAEAIMPEGEKPVRITEIHLRPRITVRGAPSQARIEALVETAHRECFIANSLTAHIRVSPKVEYSPS